MKCISLWQPWASLLVHGLKRCETRSWPTNHTGPLLIHAAKKWDAELAEFAVLHPARAALESIGVTFTATEAAARAGWGLPFGAIVGCVQLDRCYPTTRVRFMAAAVAAGDSLDATITEQAFGDFGPGRFAWYCSRFMAFAEPVPYRGAQGLFDVPGDVVREAIESAKRRAA